MAASRRSMTAPLSNKSDPADEGEEIARTLYGVCAADRYVPPGAFSTGIVTDTILLHRLAADGSPPSPGNPVKVIRTPSLALESPGTSDPVNAGHSVPARVSREPALVSPAMGCCSGRRIAMKGCWRFDP